MIEDETLTLQIHQVLHNMEEPGGKWFFLSTVSTLFGLSIVFMPYVIKNINLPKAFSRSRGLLVMIWDTLCLYAVIGVCGLHSNVHEYWRIALGITTFCIILPWAIFLVIRYLRVNALVKTGISVVLIGIFTSFINGIVSYILDGKMQQTIMSADFSSWESNNVNSNVCLIILIITLVIGLVLISLGIIKQHKKRNSNG